MPPAQHCRRRASPVTAHLYFGRPGSACSAAGRPGRVEQVECLQDRVSVRRVGLGAELVRRQLVLDLEDRLARRQERVELEALLELLALLVDGVVEPPREAPARW